MTVLCGDLHGDREKLLSIIKEHDLKEGDLLIVLGDFGFYFYNTKAEEAFLQEFARQYPCTLAFLAGNHENFPRLAQFPTEQRWGGAVRRLEKNVFQLLNGEIYTFAPGQTCFVMGGAYSIDKAIRAKELWLRLDQLPDGPVLRLEAADAEDFSLADCPTIADRDDCYALTDRLYTRLLPEVERHFPQFLEDYRDIKIFNDDSKNSGQQKRLQLLLEVTTLPKYRFFAPILAAAAAEVLAEKGDSVRFRLREGEWWPEELPTAADYRNASQNLLQQEHKVDYILSHTMPREMILRYGKTPHQKDSELTGFLEWVIYRCEYKKMYCGHWHDDRQIGEKLAILYNDTVKL